MSAARNFGVQSYCFRNFKDNATVAKLVREIGVERLEICGVHVDFNDVPAFKEVLKIYEGAGVSIVSLGVQTFVGADQEKAWFECAAAAGAKHISAHFKVDSFGKAIASCRKLSREYGIRVGIHLHGGYMFGGQPDVIRHLVELGSPEIGINIDTAWALQIGPNQGNPVNWVKNFAGQIYGVHFKDFVFDRNGQWQDVVVGEGNLDLPKFVAALDETGFDGMSVIEYEADPENPTPALKRCVERMREVL